MAVEGIEIYTDPLIEFAKQFKPKNILEIGFGFEGYSTLVWLNHTKAKVTTIDKSIWSNIVGNCQKDYPKRFTFLLGRSEVVMPTLTDKYDLIYIDGDHRYEGAKRDIENAVPLLTKGGVILLDDWGYDGRWYGVDVSDTGEVFDGEFGVQKAAKEVLKGWKHVYKDISFANGGRAYEAKSR